MTRPGSFLLLGQSLVLQSICFKVEEAVEEVLLHLALCHSVIIDKRTNKLNSSSPDELALVDGAKQQGFEFIGREPDNVLVIKDS